MAGCREGDTREGFGHHEPQGRRARPGQAREHQKTEGTAAGEPAKVEPRQEERHDEARAQIGGGLVRDAACDQPRGSQADQRALDGDGADTKAEDQDTRAAQVGQPAGGRSPGGPRDQRQASGPP